MKTTDEIKKGPEWIRVVINARPFVVSKSLEKEEIVKLLASQIVLADEELESVKRELAAKVPKWISVEERLPDNDRDILVAIYGKRVQLGYYADDVEAFVVNGEVACGEEVTHWMPLPSTEGLNDN